MTAQTHSLRANGAPCSTDGTLVSPENPKTTSGEGRAACSCGWTGPIRVTGAARRADHKEHKAAEATAPETASADFEEPAPVPAPEPASEDLLGTEEDEEESLYWVTIPFTDLVASMFFRHFGREGTKLFLAYHFPTVSVTTRSSDTSIKLKGNKEDVDAAVAALQEMWAAAAEAVNEYVKTDAEFAARPRKGLEGRKASFEMKSRFLVNFAAEYEPLA